MSEKMLSPELLFLISSLLTLVGYITYDIIDDRGGRSESGRSSEFVSNLETYVCVSILFIGNKWHTVAFKHSVIAWSAELSESGNKCNLIIRRGILVTVLDCGDVHLFDVSDVYIFQGWMIWGLWWYLFFLVFLMCIIFSGGWFEDRGDVHWVQLWFVTCLSFPDGDHQHRHDLCHDNGDTAG